MKLVLIPDWLPIPSLREMDGIPDRWYRLEKGEVWTIG